MPDSIREHTHITENDGGGPGWMIAGILVVVLLILLALYGFNRQAQPTPTETQTATSSPTVTSTTTAPPSPTSSGVKTFEGELEIQLRELDAQLTAIDPVDASVDAAPSF